MAGKDNKGFSLVEMIVILAIIAILTTGGVAAYLNWRAMNLQDCAKKIDMALSATKVDAMSKENSSMTIRLGSEGVYELRVGDEEIETLGDSNIKISYSDTDGHINVPIDGANDLTISYERATGAFKPIETNEAGEAVYCTEIQLERKGKTAQIALVRTTGKHKVL